MAWKHSQTCARAPAYTHMLDRISLQKTLFPEYAYENLQVFADYISII